MYVDYCKSLLQNKHLPQGYKTHSQEIKSQNVPWEKYIYLEIKEFSQKIPKSKENQWEKLQNIWCERKNITYLICECKKC